MNILARQIFFIIFLFFLLPVRSQSLTDSLAVYFAQGSSSLNPSFESNGVRLRRFIEYIETIRKESFSIVSVHYVSGASPEGSVSGNRQLALRRASTVTDYLRRSYSIPDSVVTVDARGEDYTLLSSLVENSEMPYRSEVLTLLRQLNAHPGTVETERLKKSLRTLHNGVAWKYMYEHFFPKLRRLDIYIKVKGVSVPEPVPVVPDTVSVLPVVPVPSPVVVPQPAVVVPEPVPVPTPARVPEVSDSPTRHWYLKTNAIGWGMLIANIAVELDLASHWSFTLPVYYSALNYFTYTIKFRTTCLQPEFRYWFSTDNSGFFAGAHLGLAWYNYANGGEWRYQDHHRHTPLYGGGFSGGYRLPLSHNRRWWLEFSLGVGSYKLHYDVFHNEPNGRLVDTRKRTFYGLDNASVSFVYRFDCEKKGVTK